MPRLHLYKINLKNTLGALPGFLSSSVPVLNNQKPHYSLIFYQLAWSLTLILGLLVSVLQSLATFTATKQVAHKVSFLLLLCITTQKGVMKRNLCTPTLL